MIKLKLIANVCSSCRTLAEQATRDPRFCCTCILKPSQNTCIPTEGDLTHCPLCSGSRNSLVHGTRPSSCWQTKPRRSWPNGFPRGGRQKSSSWSSESLSALRKQNSFWDGVRWFQLAFWAARWAHIHPLPTSTHTHSLSFTAQPGPRKGQRNSSREPPVLGLGGLPSSVQQAPSHLGPWQAVCSTTGCVCAFRVTW